MNFDLIPIDETLHILRVETDPKIVFEKIIDCCNNNLPSEIWKEYESLNLKRDIQDATIWIQNTLTKHPDTTGYYLGLDTLNMDNGKGTNLEIGLSNSCNPLDISDAWAYQCENYGKPHLIKGLSEVSDTFTNTKKWSDEEISFTEYIVFLGYSGVVLKEALNKLKTENDFLSIWGFHDGDMFFLTQKINGVRSIVTEKGL